MSLNSKYHFREAQISPPFFKSKIKEIDGLINKSVTFTILSIPGVGVTQLLRYFVSKFDYYFAFIETNSLTSFSKSNFFKLILKELEVESKSNDDQDLFLACKKRLEELSQTTTRIVLIFNRFNSFAKQIDYGFLMLLRTLKNINPEKIVMIFATNKPLSELNPKAVTGPNLNSYLYSIYLGTYSEADLRRLIPIYSPLAEIADREKLDKAVNLSGGHINLLSLLLKFEGENPATDSNIATQFKDILGTLTYSQKDILKKIAHGRKISEVNGYLLGVGLVVKDNDRLRIFSPILEEYLRIRTYIKLPAKEAKLFTLLKNNLGKVISKDEIFQKVWGDDPDLASDWALNALVYRLKRNATFKRSGYIIENYKKQGYSLIK